ncbi:MAG TPA: hypothetical protein VGQ68_04455 [Gaiellaceae bacterium]|jgi:hypothetical protein|nr:hypothetical protein [Gaiellaceae bacterium]
MADGEQDDLTASYEVVYKDAIRALDFQREAFDTLRTRTGLLLSAGAVATSFFGGRDLEQGGADNWTWFALVLFLAFGAACLKVLWPRAEGADGFSAAPSLVIQEYLEPEDDEPVSLSSLYRDLALHAEAAYEHNKTEHYDELTRFFRAGVLLLMVEVTVWVIALAEG